MTRAHRAHVQRILDQLNRELRRKYARGQREHGGRLWERAGLLDEAVGEAIDLVVYLFTLREQQRRTPPANSTRRAVTETQADTGTITPAFRTSGSRPRPRP